MIVHQDKQTGPNLMHKTITGKVNATGGVVTDTTELTLVVGGQQP